MSQVAVVARIPAAPGKRAELAAGLQFALDNVVDEPGTLAYILLEDTNDENVLWFYELYTGNEALQAHMGADWFKELGPRIREFLGGAPELHFCTPLGGKGLPG
jgi:quinol monooxygenase YgiN